eukprot:3383992-Amphidinium_carterae.1
MTVGIGRLAKRHRTRTETTVQVSHLQFVEAHVLCLDWFRSSSPGMDSGAVALRGPFHDFFSGARFHANCILIVELWHAAVDAETLALALHPALG